MLISIGVNYVAGLLMEKYDEKPKVRKICFWVAFIVTLGFCFSLKCTNFPFPISMLCWHWAALLVLRNLHRRWESELLYLPDFGNYTIGILQAQNQGWNTTLIDFGAFVVLFPRMIARSYTFCIPDIQAKGLKEPLRVTPLPRLRKVGLFIMGLARQDSACRYHRLFCGPRGATLGIFNVSPPLCMGWAYWHTTSRSISISAAIR